MELQQAFEAAVAQSKTLSEKPGNDILLQLYSLYKQASEGDAPEKGEYGLFDFVGKAKHDAWAARRGTASAAAMQQYIDLVQELSKA